MPRNGAGVYSTPLGTDAISDQTIASTPYNTNVHDLEQDNNVPRPIVAGGTGATNAVDARANLQAEVSGMQVINYDSHIFENGSFWSAPGATGAPNGINYFTGICYLSGPNGFIQARPLTGMSPEKCYIREKNGGAWGTWEIDGVGQYVDVTGDTMTGDLSISKAWPTVALNKPASGTGSTINGSTNNLLRWQMQLGDNATESGGDVGSDFVLARYNDAGTIQQVAMKVKRDTGTVAVNKELWVTGAGNNSLLLGPFAQSFLGNSQARIGYNSGGITFRPTVDGIFPLIFMNAADAVVGSVSTTATVTSYNTSSSAELKEDLKSFDASAIIEATNVYDFAWKSTKERAFGVLAQQAVTVYPQAVTYDAERDFWGVNYAAYVPVLLQELKALRARVAQLEAGIASKPA